MTMLSFKFRVDLEDYEREHIQYHGPLFHKWLPDGPADALTLLRSPQTELKVWFERFGFVDHSGFIKFHYKKRDIDAGIVCQQAKLDAGPLFGLLTMPVSQEDIDALERGKLGDERCLALGRSIIDIIYPPVARLLGVIRITYGQFWIRELEAWNSQKASLGAYCRGLYLQWSKDGSTWTPFVPNESIQFHRVVVVVGKHYDDLISHEDWKELERIVHSGYEPTLAGHMIARARQLMDEGNFKYALIEGVSALEVAIGEFLRGNTQEAALLKTIGELRNAKLQIKTIAAAGLLGATVKDVQLATEAIELRHNVVHKGQEVEPSAKKLVSGLFSIVASLLSGPKFRFPSSDSSNSREVPRILASTPEGQSV